MKEYYMTKIWQIIGLKENQDLDSNQKQALIIGALTEMENRVKEDTKRGLKAEYKRVLDETIDSI